MYTTQQVKEAAEKAAAHTATTIAGDPTFRFVTMEVLIEMSGLTPPDDNEPSILVTKQWGFNLMQLRENWRHLVLDQVGRWPKTVRGVGFEILKPHKNIEHADTKVLHDVVRAIQKGKQIIRKTRDTDLTQQQQRRKINSELRFSALHSAAVSAEAQAERERMWRSEEPTPQPTPQPHYEEQS